MIRSLSLVAGLLMLAACSEKPDSTALRKVDDKAWDGTATAYAAQGYKGGTKEAWEQQLKSRNQSQNEYNRTTSR